jgi:nitrogen fixation protein FixH
MKLMTAVRPWTGRTILSALLTTFGIVFVVNGIFVYFAVTTWPGLSQTDAYEKGLRYNEVIKAAQRQRDLGWQSDVTFAANGQIHVRIDGPGDRMIVVARADLTLERPFGDVASRTVRLSQRQDGTLSAQTAPFIAGNWHATLTVVGAAGETYRMQHVVEILP